MEWKYPKILQINISLKELCQVLIRELVGSCVLVIMGCGSVLAALIGNSESFNITGVALCWGITVATLSVSLQCHMNPAVTIAFASLGKISIVTSALYIVTQCVGAALGAQILVGLTPINTTWSLGATQIMDGVSPLQGFGMEFISTFLLLLVISGANDKANEQKGSPHLAIGLCVSALILFCGPFTGASMNPARSFGPSLIHGDWENHWVFWVGPVSGGVTGSVLYHLLFHYALVQHETITKADIKKRYAIDGENNPTFGTEELP